MPIDYNLLSTEELENLAIKFNLDGYGDQRGFADRNIIITQLRARDEANARRKIEMREGPEFNIAMSRLSSLRRNVPKDISESVVNEYHAIVDELEPGCGNLAGFRIKDTEVKPKIIPMPFYVCQGRSKTRPVRRSKSRPVDSGVVVVRYAG